MSALDYYKSYEFVQAEVQLAGTPIAYTGAASDTLSATAHGLADGDVIVMTSHVTTANVTDGLKYFVRDKAADTFKIALTSGGSAIAVGSTGSGVVTPYIFVELDWANKGASSTDKNTFEWAGSARSKKIETIKSITQTIDLDAIPVEAHALIFSKGAITGAFPSGLTTASIVGFGGGDDASGAACGLLLNGYALKGETETVVNIAVWYPVGTLSLVSAPGFNTGATGDKFQYSFAAAKTAVDIAGGTISGASTGGEYFFVSESN